MDWKIKDLMAETKAPLRHGYWKITAVSFLMILLSAGVSYSSLIGSVNELPELVRNILANGIEGAGKADVKVIAMLLTLTGGMLLLSLMVKFVMDVFLENPLEVGINKMLVKAMDTENDVMLADIMFAYDADYINNVKVLFMKKFLRDLWLLLLVVPGVIKGYEYRMIPYLLSENPYQSHKEAFAESKRLMDGYKKKAFLMDLYFIPWHILGIATFGIAEIFYVAPKQNMVNACFYLKVKEAKAQSKGEE